MDDAKANLDILVEGLKPNHKLSLALNGEMALQIAARIGRKEKLAVIPPSRSPSFGPSSSNAEDIPNVEKVQAENKAQPLSAYGRKETHGFGTEALSPVLCRVQQFDWRPTDARLQTELRTLDE